MTTYLATTTISVFEETITLAFCSRKCREASSYRDGWTGRYNAIDFYEFDETCHYCLEIVPACGPRVSYSDFAGKVSRWIGEIDVHVPASERALCPDLPTVIRDRVNRVYRGDCVGGDTYEVSLAGAALIVPLSWVELVIDDDAERPDLEDALGFDVDPFGPSSGDLELALLPTPPIRL
jgi:hypothetical protein